VNVFNTLHPRIQFTMKIGGNRLNFLDVAINNNNNNKLEFDWFYKFFDWENIKILNNEKFCGKRFPKCWILNFKKIA